MALEPYVPEPGKELLNIHFQLKPSFRECLVEIEKDFEAIEQALLAGREICLTVHTPLTKP